jgi:hypothetical protein
MIHCVSRADARRELRGPPVITARSSSVSLRVPENLLKYLHTRVFTSENSPDQWRFSTFHVRKLLVSHCRITVYGHRGPIVDAPRFE